MSATHRALTAPAERADLRGDERIDDAVADPARGTAAECLGHDCSVRRALGERTPVAVGDATLACDEEPRAERDARRPEGERGRDPAAVHDAAAGDDRHSGSEGVDDLGNEGEGADLGPRRIDVDSDEGAAVTAGLTALRDHAARPGRHGAHGLLPAS